MNNKSPVFGMQVLGPIETNLGGQGISAAWPSWKPTSFRCLNNWGGVPPNYTYTQGVSEWSGVETSPGVFDWSLFDLVWAKLIAEGVTDVLFGFEDIPAWAYSNGVFDLAAVSAWVTAYLTRAKADGLAIKYVEGINEADVPNSWGTDASGNPFGGTTQDQVNIQQAIYRAAKAFDPSILVLSPPYNSPQAAALYFSNFLIAGGGQWCDIIGFHGYSDANISKPSGYQKYLNQFLAILKADGQGNKPIWNTEYDALTPDVSSATAFIDWAAGVARRFYYAWDAEVPLWTWQTQAETAAGIAYQQLMSWLRDATLQSLVLSGEIWTATLQTPQGLTQAVWTDDGSTPFYHAPHWATCYHDLAGGVIKLSKHSKMSLSANPILFASQ